MSQTNLLEQYIKSTYNIDVISAPSSKENEAIIRSFNRIPEWIRSKLQTRSIEFLNLGRCSVSFPNKGFFKKDNIGLNNRLNIDLGTFMNNISWIDFIITHEVCHDIDQNVLG